MTVEMMTADRPNPGYCDTVRVARGRSPLLRGVIPGLLVCLLAAGIAHAGTASSRTWDVKTSKAGVASGVFTNDSNLVVSAVSVEAQGPGNSVISFVFAGNTCAVDAQTHEPTCTGLTLAAGKTATFRVTTKLAFSKGGFRGCYGGTQPAGAPPPGNHPGGNPPSGNPPNQAPIQLNHCDAVNHHAQPAPSHHSTRPKVSASVNAHIRALLAQAVANDKRASGYLKAKHTTLARGALVKAIAELTSIEKLAAGRDVNGADRNFVPSLALTRAALNNGTENPTALQIKQSRARLASAVMLETAASKLLRAIS
jgi:hypothetical protein